MLSSLELSDTQVYEPETLNPKRAGDGVKAAEEAAKASDAALEQVRERVCVCECVSVSVSVRERESVCECECECERKEAAKASEAALEQVRRLVAVINSYSFL